MVSLSQVDDFIHDLMTLSDPEKQFLAQQK